MAVGQIQSKVRRVGVRLGLSVFVFFVLTELTLRLFPGLVPGALGNEIYGPYRRFGGMYYWDQPTNYRFMFPNDEREVRFNGYTWQHQTDELGFRNPAGIESDVILIGDSMIYGHGVEVEQTVAAVLREKGWKAYSLGQQGTSIDWQHAMISTYAGPLKAKTVYLFPLVNDFKDIEDEAVKFETPPEFDLDTEALAQRRQHPSSSVRDYLARLRTVRLLEVLWKLSKRSAHKTANRGASVSRVSRPSWVEALLDRERYERNAEYFGKLLSDLAERCHQQGIELRVVFLHTRDPDEDWKLTQEAMGNFLALQCEKLDIPYASTRELFKDHDECFLPGDGHFTEAGHRRLAQFLLEQNRIPTGTRGGVSGADENTKGSGEVAGP